jgi:large subunit ribosomal protein L10
MNKTEKTQVIEELKEKFENSQYFYIADSSTLTVGEINKLRALCHEKGVEMKVVKNTLAKKALESFDDDKNFGQLFEALKGPSTLLFSDTGNVPAKLIKEYRQTSERPLLKAAYIDSDVFLGDDQLEALSSLKSKEELIGDVIVLLQSPIKNLLGSLQSGQNTISGLLKALENRGE